MDKVEAFEAARKTGDPQGQTEKEEEGLVHLSLSSRSIPPDWTWGAGGEMKIGARGHEILRRVGPQTEKNLDALF